MVIMSHYYNIKYVKVTPFVFKYCHTESLFTLLHLHALKGYFTPKKKILL